MLCRGGEGGAVLGAGVAETARVACTDQLLPSNGSMCQAHLVQHMQRSSSAGVCTCKGMRPSHRFCGCAAETVVSVDVISVVSRCLNVKYGTLHSHDGSSNAAI
jgi:hypothetical protein